MVALASAGSARATLITSTFGPGDYYDTSLSWGVGSAEVAAHFVPDVDATLDTIRIAASFVGDVGINNFTVY